MSSLVEGLASLNKKDSNIVGSNMKEEEERKMSKKERLSCELREKRDMGEELRKEKSEKEKEKEEIDSVEAPKCASSSEKQQIASSIKVSVAEEGGGGSSSSRKEAKVEIVSLTVISPGRADIVLPIPFGATTSKATLFSLKEGSKYRIKFHLTVSGNASVENLKYTYMVWKSGIRVHQTKKMVGTFSPRQEAYVYELEEGTTPTGFFARGPFFVKSKFVDDDGKCYLDTNYYFDITKDWAATE